jgi:molybdopterin converting factor subunit 1
VAIHGQNTMRGDFLTLRATGQYQARIPAIDTWYSVLHILTSVREAAPAKEICVHVRFFASYREAAGANRLDAPLPVGARVADLVQLLAARVPSLLTAPGLIAVNHAYVQPDAELREGDEVAFIPPVSGGARV